jgi:hypothetical protein
LNLFVGSEENDDNPIKVAGILTEKAVSKLRGLVACFLPLRPGFEPRSSHVGFMVDEVALGHVFSEYVGFPCKFSFYPTTPHSSSSIIQGCYNRPISGRRTKWTQSHPTPRN